MPCFYALRVAAVQLFMPLHPRKSIAICTRCAIVCSKKGQQLHKSAFLCNCRREKRGTIAHALFWFNFRKNSIPLDIPCFRTLSGGISDGKRHNSIYSSMYLIKISGRKSGKPFSTHEKRGHLTASSLNQQLI